MCYYMAKRYHNYKTGLLSSFYFMPGNSRNERMYKSKAFSLHAAIRVSSDFLLLNRDKSNQIKCKGHSPNFCNYITQFLWQLWHTVCMMSARNQLTALKLFIYF